MIAGEVAGWVLQAERTPIPACLQNVWKQAKVRLIVLAELDASLSASIIFVFGTNSVASRKIHFRRNVSRRPFKYKIIHVKDVSGNESVFSVSRGRPATRVWATGQFVPAYIFKIIFIC